MTITASTAERLDTILHGYEVAEADEALCELNAAESMHEALGQVFIYADELSDLHSGLCDSIVAGLHGLP